MGKNKRNTIKYNSLEFDSNEEIDFYKWCEDAYLNNIIESFEYQPKEFVLSEKKTIRIEKILKTKTKIVEKHIFHPHIYTADFVIKPKEIDWLNNFLILSEDGNFWVDVKGSFQKFDGARSFSINRKWVYDKFSIYINEITPKKFFPLTFVPKDSILTPNTKKIRKSFEKCKTIDQIVLELESMRL